MRSLLAFTSGRRDEAADPLAAQAPAGIAVRPVDLYAFDELRLEDHAAILIGMHVDQRHLAARAARLDGYVRGGGTMVANGHHAYPFVPGLGPFRPIPDARLRDLAILRRADHPVWAGVSADELTFRRGVAGFYGRGWHEGPEGATVVHTVGTSERPVDLVYAWGAGRVLFHGGNDLWQYARGSDSTGRLLPQLFAWLGRDAP